VWRGINVYRGREGRDQGCVRASCSTLKMAAADSFKIIGIHILKTYTLSHPRRILIYSLP
jgi:hypothetical protein